MTYEKYVFVELPGDDQPIPAGLFQLDTDLGVGQFEYGRRYLLRQNAIALDPVNLPLSETTFVTKKNNGIFGVIGDVIPDSWGKFILSKKLKVPFGTLSDQKLLNLADSNCVGALCFGDSPARPTTPTVPPAPFGDLKEIAHLFDKVMKDEDLPPEVLYLLQQGTSLGGAQPKCAVAKDGKEYIAKFESSKTLIKFPRIEYATMTLARKVGITTPAIHLEEIAGRAVYLIERFDRKEGRRLPFLSAMALSNLDIDELENGSYLALAADMRKFTKHTKRDLEQLYQRIVFNVLVRNGDDHLRNHGFVYTGHWSLSPAYDIVPMVAQSKVDFHLCLELGTLGTVASLENILSRCDAFGITRGKAREIIAQTKDCLADWENIMKTAEVTKSDIDSIRRSFEF